MIDLVQHSIQNEVEIDVSQTNNLSLKDVLIELLKILKMIITKIKTEDKNTEEKRIEEKITTINQNRSYQTSIYFTTDLCHMYNVSESTIYNYRKNGKLPFCSDGQKVWFTQEHIDEFNWNSDSRNKKSNIQETA